MTNKEIIAEIGKTTDYNKKLELLVSMDCSNFTNKQWKVWRSLKAWFTAASKLSSELDLLN